MSTSTHSLSGMPSGSNALALLIGALLTPVATGLSLQIFPMGAPALVYAFVAGFFAFRHPEQDWQWGLWAAGGMVVALMGVLLIGGSFMWWTGNSVDLGGGWSIVKVTLIFGFVPALAGGCLGGAGGSLLARGSYNKFAVVIAVLSAVLITIVIYNYIVA